MSVRKLASLVSMTALALFAFTAFASASTALRTDPGNSLLAGAPTLTSNAGDRFTLQLSIGSVVTCNQTSFDADLNTNASAASITGKLTAITFTSCTDNIPVISFTSCRLHPATAPTVHIFANRDTGGDVTITDLIIRCGIQGGNLACYITSSSVTGAYNNASSSLSFSSVAGVPVTTTTDALGAQICGTGVASVTFTDIQSGTGRTVTVTTT
jgi:hypothetical protein